MTNAPVKKFRLGFVTANVWKNEGTNKPFYTVTLERTYKDHDENYQSTDNLNAGDLLNAAKVLCRAEAFIADQ